MHVATTGCSSPSLFGEFESDPAIGLVLLQGTGEASPCWSCSSSPEPMRGAFVDLGAIRIGRGSPGDV